MHQHNDKKIKTCSICQKTIKEIEKAGRKLDKLGIWNFSKDPKKRLKNGEEIEVWRKNKKIK